MIAYVVTRKGFVRQITGHTLDGLNAVRWIDYREDHLLIGVYNEQKMRMLSFDEVKLNLSEDEKLLFNNSDYKSHLSNVNDWQNGLRRVYKWSPYDIIDDLNNIVVRTVDATGFPKLVDIKNANEHELRYNLGLFNDIFADDSNYELVQGGTALELDYSALVGMLRRLEVTVKVENDSDDDPSVVIEIETLVCEAKNWVNYGIADIIYEMVKSGNVEGFRFDVDFYGLSNDKTMSKSDYIKLYESRMVNIVNYSA